LALVPGTVRCFFTDGLVERRYQPLDDYLNRLCEIVSPRPPETVAASVMRALIGSEHVSDDTPLLVLGWQG
jgi:phosphoserine phosphatase RsbU/P